MGIYFGTYRRTLDAKRRLQIPSRLMNAEAGMMLYVLRGFDGCLDIYDEDGFQKKINELLSRDTLDSASRDYVRLSASSVEPLQVDSHGRIMLPAELLGRHSISQDVTILGALDHFELWDTKAYEEYFADRSNRFEELAERSKKYE